MATALICLGAAILCGAIWYVIKCMEAIEIIVNALNCEHGDDDN